MPDQAYDDTEEVDEAELARDKIVKRVIVSSVTRPIGKRSDVEAEIREKFANIGVHVEEIRTRMNYRGDFERSLVDISQVNLKRILGQRLGLKHCCVVEFEG